MTIAKPIIFDGHNDVLSKIFNEGGVAKAASFLNGREGAIDLKKAKVGGFGGGFFAVYVPSKFDLDFSYKEMEKASYSLPLPEPIEWSEAVAVVASQVTILRELERLGGLKICYSVSDIRSAFENGNTRQRNGKRSFGERKEEGHTRKGGIKRKVEECRGKPPEGAEGQR